MENKRSPPAMRNAGSEIDSVRNSQSPISAVPMRIAPAMMLARTATLRRDGRGKSSVTARKVGTSPTGSTTTSSVSSADMAKSSGMAASHDNQVRGLEPRDHFQCLAGLGATDRIELIRRMPELTDFLGK